MAITECYVSWNGVPQHRFPTSLVLGSTCQCGAVTITQKMLDEWEEGLQRAATIISCAN